MGASPRVHELRIRGTANCHYTCRPNAVAWWSRLNSRPRTAEEQPEVMRGKSRFEWQKCARYRPNYGPARRVGQRLHGRLLRHPTAPTAQERPLGTTVPGPGNSSFRAMAYLSRGERTQQRAHRRGRRFSGLTHQGPGRGRLSPRDLLTLKMPYPSTARLRSG